MANRHYGKIGDIWKHLPLAEILASEKPSYYWETHAGSAQYALSHSWERDYGIFHFFEQAIIFDKLNSSIYFDVLRRCKDHTQRLSIYPGSPLIAMSLLDKSAECIFCDLDSESLDNIRNTAQNLQIPDRAVTCIQNDGISAIAEAASQLFSQKASETFVHIDPYQPLNKSPNDLNSIELFCELSKMGFKTMLWYGYDSKNKEYLWQEINRIIYENKIEVCQHALWCGEIYLLESTNPEFSLNPGVMGCGILCTNLSEKSISACIELGKELQNLYQNVIFPNGQSGAIAYHSISLG